MGISSSFKDSDYFKDLEGGISATVPENRAPHDSKISSINKRVQTSLPTLFSRVNAPSLPCYTHPEEEPHCNFVVTQLSPKSHPGCIINSSDSSGLAVGLSLTINLNGLLESVETAKGKTLSDCVTTPTTMDSEGEPDEDSFPILVRSMSTSRRHSLGVPVSPINLGRRLSLDTMAMNSDGEREDDEERQNSLFQSTQQQTYSCTACPVDETDSPRLRVPRPRADVTQMASGSLGRHLYSRSEILASDEYPQAAHISHVVQTSKQAARAAGAEEFDPEENLHSTDGQSHIVKQRNNRSDVKNSESVTWYEFLSHKNEEEEDRTEKVEKGTKVKRTLSSLRNRMAGSFNKDKGKNREKDPQKEKDAKDKLCGRSSSSNSSSSSSGHYLVPGAFSSCATCSLCSKSLQKRHGLQCMSE
ncbi:hypothetical protein JOB18_039884 [Solea senegalensis]|uniref:Uncharacterized protein n=1 Tax=Solea senegalensis TaxID=28829 RepID=A0AAV6SBN0_SOLSE|nr:hypothetical protein JOB18_039884 [Solea senegalensis]